MYSCSTKNSIKDFNLNNYQKLIHFDENWYSKINNSYFNFLDTASIAQHLNQKNKVDFFKNQIEFQMYYLI